MTLKAIALLKPVLVASGVDYPQLVTILTAKKLVDDRVESPLYQGNSQNNRLLKGKWLTFLSYALIGLFTAMVTAAIQDAASALALMIGMLFVLMSMTLIANFTSVLLDVKENQQLHVRPVKRATIVAAKLLYIIGYLLFYSGALMLFSLAAITYKHGLGVGLYSLLAIVLINLIIVVISALTYLLVLRFYDGEKLKNVVTYIQVGITVLSSIGYAFLSHALTLTRHIEDLKLAWYHLLIPPMWYPAWLMAADGPLVWIMRTLAIIAPIVLIILYITRWANQFENYLYKLEQAGKSKHNHHFNRRLGIMANALTRDGIEHSGFVFSWLNLKRDRKLKQLITSNLAVAIIYPFIFTLGRGTSLSPSFFSYLSFAMILYGAWMLSIGENPDAQWLYRMAPVDDYFYFKRGAQKAYVVKLALPIIIFLTLSIFALEGLASALPFAIVGIFVLSFIRFEVRQMNRIMPFSQALEKQQSNKARGIINMFKYMGIPAILSVALNFILGMQNTLYLGIALAVGLTILAYLMYFTDFLKAMLNTPHFSSKRG